MDSIMINVWFNSYLKYNHQKFYIIFFSIPLYVNTALYKIYIYYLLGKQKLEAMVCRNFIL